MARLTTGARAKLKPSQFALPEKGGYPDDTIGRARNALSPVSQYGTPTQKAKVRAKVARDYPGIKRPRGRKPSAPAIAAARAAAPARPGASVARSAAGSRRAPGGRASRRGRAGKLNRHAT